MVKKKRGGSWLNKLEKQWVIIDLQGNVYKVCKGKAHAMVLSKEYGFGTRIITTEELQRLRETGSLD